MNNIVVCILITLLLALYGCKSTEPAERKAESELTYLNIDNIQYIKNNMSQLDSTYSSALDDILKNADKALTRKANPVTNKSQSAASGNLHDYLSLGPYWWPDPTKPDGLPWIRKDGEINPLTRGDNTDQNRDREFLHDLGYLNLAYLYSGKTKYLAKAKGLLDLWLVDPKTKMNPHLDYAQGVPGESTGRPFGIIEWENIANVVTTVELISQNRFANAAFLNAANTWLEEYLHWMTTSKIGKQEDATTNNHANWYDFQVIGLMLHLDKLPAATQYSQLVKTRRIDVQILSSGAQPRELARTKSVSYSSMNLMALLRVAELAKRHLDIDLLHYRGEQGQSIKGAIEFMLPYAQGTKTWQYQQITGVNKAFKHKASNTFYVADRLFDQALIPRQLLTQNMTYIKSSLLLSFRPYKENFAH